MGGIYLLEGVLPNTGFLLGLAEGGPGGGGREVDFRALDRFRCRESPEARSRALLVLDNFGFSQRE